jgi:hypothetical protein
LELNLLKWKGKDCRVEYPFPGSCEEFDIVLNGREYAIKATYRGLEIKRIVLLPRPHFFFPPIPEVWHCFRDGTDWRLRNDSFPG